MKIRLTENAMCAHDLHELTNYQRPWFKAKPILPKGTVLTVKEQWINFFGSYYRCDHENGTYDIKRSEAEVIEM